MKKNDFILIGVVCLCAIVYYIGYSFYAEDGESVVITVEGIEYGTYDLSENQEVVIEEGKNILEIQDGEAYMIEADCPDGLCIHQGKIHRNRESIICLPNQVVVEIKSTTESEYDAIVK